MNQRTKLGSQSRRRSSARSLPRQIGDLVTSGNMRFAAFVAFVLLVGWAGGSSRPDVPALMLLRPAALLFATYALCLATREQLRSVRMPLLVIAALMLLSLLQLVPLPVGLWTALPGRGDVARLSALVGMVDAWRPLTLDPSRTWNTFFALSVPLATVCLVAIQAPRHRGWLVPVLMAVGLVSAAIGYLQLINGGSLRLYDVVHSNAPIGLFANKNHQSIMLVGLMVGASWFASDADPRDKRGRAVFISSLVVLFLLFPLLLLSRSRAGLLISVPGLLLCCWLIFRSLTMRAVLRQSPKRAKLTMIGFVGAVFAPLLFVIGLLVFSDRNTAVSRFFERDAAEDLRWLYFKYFIQMIEDFMPFGSGFGSFQNVFNMYEPADLLTASYMNQAHNDPVQVLIEGGLPALAIMAAGLCWLGSAAWRLWHSPRPRSRSAAAFFVGSIVLWLAASVVDYPLRTPLAAMLVGVLTAQLSFLSTARNLDRTRLAHDVRRPVQSGDAAPVPHGVR